MPVRAGSYPSSRRCAVARKAIYRKRLVLALKLMPRVTETEREMLHPEG